MAVAMDTPGRAAEAIVKVLSCATLQHGTFQSSIATMRALGEALDDAPESAGGGAPRPGARRPRRAVPLIGARTWDDGDPGLVLLRERLYSEPRFYIDKEYRSFTPLMKVCIEGSADAVQALLRAGANVDVEARKGFTALSWACIMGHRAIVFILLAAGAMLDFPSITEGKTPLVHAVINNRLEVVLLLLQVMFERCGCRASVCISTSPTRDCIGGLTLLFLLPPRPYAHTRVTAAVGCVVCQGVRHALQAQAQGGDDDVPHGD